MRKGSIGSGLYLLGWIVTFSTAAVLGAVVPWYFALAPPWNQIVGMICLGVPILIYSRLGTWLQPERRGWLVIDAFFRPSDPHVHADRIRRIRARTLRLTLIVAMASLIAWLLFFLAITPDDLTPQVFRAAVWNSVRIAAVMALVTGIFGWLLYASRVGREATDPANRRNDA